MKKFGGYLFFSYSLPTTHYNITISANKEGTLLFLMITFWKVSDP